MAILTSTFEGALQSALDLKRTRRFWAVGAVAVCLPFLSWINPFLIDSLNVHFFGSKGFDDPGGWLYVFLRLPLVVFLLWAILKFPTRIDSVQSRPTSMEDVGLFDPLMGLRALACLLVLMGHYFLVLFPFPNDGVNVLTRALLRSSPWAGVWVFFTLSGYLMGKGFTVGRYSLDEFGSRAFWRNRALRILPIYVVGVLIVSIYRYTSIFELKHFWMLIEILIFDYRGELPISPIGPIWSVSTEVQFYLLVPFLAVALFHLKRRTGKLFVLIPIVITAIATTGRLWLAAHHPAHMYALGYTPLIPNLDLFVAGMCVNFLPHRFKPNREMRRMLSVSLLVAALGFYLFISLISRAIGYLHIPFEDFWATGPVVAMSFTTIFIRITELSGRIKINEGFFGKCLFAIQGMGRLTYCLYVFHNEIMNRNAELMPETHSLRGSLVTFPSVMLQVLFVSILFYLTIEKPFEAKKGIGRITPR
jgi:peptidoglycan/LPS O-acetylase OafA/YrhL